jgi:ferredoxin
MGMKIDSDECTACGDCASACQNQAIISKAAYFSVNLDKCTECETEASPRCMDVCPANCIDFA